MPKITHHWTTKHFAKLPTVPGISPLLTRMLLIRGIHPNQMRSFLRADADLIRPWSELTGVDLAAQQIHRARLQGKKIIIVGDYDVDGITASVLCYKVLTFLQAETRIVIPDRRKDGYGLSNGVVQRICAQEAQPHHCLLLTVDNGANAGAAIQLALDLGIEVVVTDHHPSQTSLPPAVIQVNPNQAQSSYGFSGLAGVGVAWKVAQALLELSGYPEKSAEYLDLVALGTIADVCPLLDENRALVRLGLEQLNQQPSPGMRALMQHQLGFRGSGTNKNPATIPGPASNLRKPLPVTAQDIGMYIAPCLNAAGRIGDVQEAVHLLLCTEEQIAEELAQNLILVNNQRKKITQQGLDQARQIVEAWPELPPIILLTLPELDESICGLVAGRVKELYYRPTLVLTQVAPEEWKGSGRSIPGFDLTQLLGALKPQIQGGGHALACGLTVKSEHLLGLQEQIQYFGTQYTDLEQFKSVLHVDLPLELNQLTGSTARELQQLEPFGASWPQPLVGLRQVTLQGGVMGKTGEHLRLRSTKNGLVFKGWRLYPKYLDLGAPPCLDILGQLKWSTWQNQERLELEMIDFRRNIDNPAESNISCRKI